MEGRYLVEKVIGQGTYGRVYSSIDRRTKLKCAIKEIQMPIMDAEKDGILSLDQAEELSLL